MFIRWKKGTHKNIAYLVKSVRINGKPRYETIALLCSVSADKPNAVIAWAQVEMKLQEINLPEQECTLVSQCLEKTIKRPSTEAIEQQKRIIAGLMAQIERHKANVVPNIPPQRIDLPPTGVDIQWSVNPKQGGKYLYYTASLVIGEQTIELGTIEQFYLDKPKWNHEFWFSVHSALILAHVGYETYEKTLQALETWVDRLPSDEFVGVIQRKQQYKLYEITKEKHALFRRIARLDAKERELLDVRKHGTGFLAEIQRSAPNA